MPTSPRGYAAAEPGPGIDLAPMLDFVVNLLIFFIITAVFVKESGVTVSRPTGIKSKGDNLSKSVAIDEHGDISIDGKAIDPLAVRAHIERFRAADSAGGILIVADERAPTGVVVGVVDQTHLAGIWDITFTTARANTVP